MFKTKKVLMVSFMAALTACLFFKKVSDVFSYNNGSLVTCYDSLMCNYNDWTYFHCGDCTQIDGFWAFNKGTCRPYC